MKKLTFKNTEEFIAKMDGNVYTITTTDGKDFFCELEEKEFITLFDEGKILDLNSNRDFNKKIEGSYSDYLLADEKFKDDVLALAIDITIENFEEQLNEETEE